MDIGIIGTGNVGSALAIAWANQGHHITLGARDPDKAQPLAASINAEVVSPTDIAGADVIVLAVPWIAARDILAGLGDLSGRIVIDCTNPIGPIDGRLGLLVGHNTSGAEELAETALNAYIVKTLNQVGAEVIAAARDMRSPPAMLMAADNSMAKATVATLLHDIGFDPLDAGELSKARLLEPYALVWINQALAQGKGRRWALAVHELPHV